MSDASLMPAWCRHDAGLAVAKVQVYGLPGAAARLAEAIGVITPKPNRYTEGIGIALAAIAPDEWLLIGLTDQVAAALERTDAALRGETILTLDITHGLVALQLEGAAGTACLAAFTALDLRPASTPVGAALRTRFGDIGVLVACTDHAPTYLLLADQSYTPYLLHLISQSASLA
ncbi:sarcosine oxidase subunit gamma [Sphingopyxis sp.]|uniref:sarcosine oxidase subunit gamma n=1 Tax=Sphingopyxis sp. TaxID=1908224 RepID=UPI001D936F86|nr:sarcosine oxidase subunit gamma family protein [Sphingopyxis sp.]MBW8295150.1 hypothetical protein [Sphingopyxis sp.]